jgi:retron-type reverse transcriptase
MKKYTNLYSQIYSFENLLKASKNAQKGKRFKDNVSLFNFNLEKELIDIQDSLKSKTYKPKAYYSFKIYEPKERLISAAAYRDRVVHHALCNIIEPVFDRAFIFDSYANRKGKGTHKAINKYQVFAKKNNYVLKADIKKYFPSIDLEILKAEIRKKISCTDTLWLIDLIIDNSNKQEDAYEYFAEDNLFTPFERRKGIPIGNLTSQFFANIYLNGLDHYIKEKLKCRYYIRYVDDFVVFDNDKNKLQEINRQIQDYLVRYRLKVHQNKTKIFPVRIGICFLGHRVFKDFRLLKKENLKRFRLKLKKKKLLLEKGGITDKYFCQSLGSWLAHAKFSNTYRLRNKILSTLASELRDKFDDDVSCSWRFVEQQREQLPCR